MNKSTKNPKPTRSKPPLKIITVSYYSGNKKMGDVFENVLSEQIRNKAKNKI